MRFKIYKKFWVSLVIITLVIIVIYNPQYLNDHHSEQSSTQEEQKYINLRAFAKLYGYVRYFHPSDESSEIDWNRFAIYGVEQVKRAENTNQLKQILEDLFIPIAPTLVIYKNNEKPTIDTKNTTNELIAWQHYGVGTFYEPSIYKSKRVSSFVKSGELILSEHKLFNEYPKPNESINKPISQKLNAIVPVILYKDSSGTIGSNQDITRKFERLKEQLDQLKSPYRSDNENVRLAGVIITWNILQHFYPYFHVTDSKWDEQLVPALIKTAKDQRKEQYLNTLISLMKKAKDGHANLTFMGELLNGQRLPFLVEIIDNQVVVTVATENAKVRPGDIITSINQTDAMEVINQLKNNIIGSPQLKNYLAAQYLIYNDKVTLEILRGGKEFRFEVEGKNNIQLDEFNRTNTLNEINENVYYINLTASNAQHVYESNIDKLSGAKGIIFDLRGYPSSYKLMQHIIGHLTNEPLKGPIARIPKTIYPDQENVKYDEISETINPQKPKFNGKVIFLTYNGPMSMPEFFLGYVKDNSLGEIVGQPTAGADGNIQKFQIPGNIIGHFTGMEMLNADRSQTHLIGIQPNVLIKRNIESIRSGKDEYIQKALELINR